MVKRQKTKNELKILEHVSVVDIYNTFVVPLDPKKFHPMSEERVTGLCPFHVDTDPSLRYWKQKKILHCFGCGFSGDAIYTYLRLRKQYYGDRKLDIQTAVRQLAQHFGVEIDEEEGFEQVSVFDKARNILLDKETLTIPNDIITIAQYKKMNNQIKLSNATLDSKIHNFAMLDLMTAVNINIRK